MTTPPVLYSGVDASQPPGTLPAWHVDIICGYVGDASLPGPPDTPHIWTPAEWNTLYEQSGGRVRMLPIYVHNYPGDPKQDAANAVAAARALGWAPNLAGTSRRIIALDLETMVDRTYVAMLETYVWDAGFAAMPYGSNYYVLQNPPGVGYWVADLVTRAPRYLGAQVQGVQWQWGAVWDRSVFSQRVWDGCGVGPRHG
jgi:hypothetical protein